MTWKVFAVQTRSQTKLIIFTLWYSLLSMTMGFSCIMFYVRQSVILTLMLGFAVVNCSKYTLGDEIYATESEPILNFNSFMHAFVSDMRHVLENRLVIVDAEGSVGDADLSGERVPYAGPLRHIHQLESAQISEGSLTHVGHHLLNDPLISRLVGWPRRMRDLPIVMQHSYADQLRLMDEVARGLLRSMGSRSKYVNLAEIAKKLEALGEEEKRLAIETIDDSLVVDGINQLIRRGQVVKMNSDNSRAKLLNSLREAQESLSVLIESTHPPEMEALMGSAMLLVSDQLVSEFKTDELRFRSMSLNILRYLQSNDEERMRSDMESLSQMMKQIASHIEQMSSAGDSLRTIKRTCRELIGMLTTSRDQADRFIQIVNTDFQVSM